MPKTRRRRSRRGGKKWWQFWKKKSKPTPLSFNNAEMVNEDVFDETAFDKTANVGLLMKAAQETDYQSDPIPTRMDVRAHETSREAALRKGVLGRKARRERRAANNTQSGRGRFRKRRRSRRRSRRRRSRRRRSRRRRSRRRRH